MLRFMGFVGNVWQVARAHVEMMSAYRRVAKAYPWLPKPPSRLRWYQLVILVVLLDLIASGAAGAAARRASGAR